MKAQWTGDQNLWIWSRRATTRLQRSALLCSKAAGWECQLSHQTTLDRSIDRLSALCSSQQVVTCICTLRYAVSSCDAGWGLHECGDLFHLACSIVNARLFTSGCRWSWYRMRTLCSRVLVCDAVTADWASVWYLSMSTLLFVETNYFSLLLIRSNRAGKLAQWNDWIRAGWPKFDPRQEEVIFLFVTRSIPGLRLTQPPIHMIMGAVSQEVTRTEREAK